MKITKGWLKEQGACSNGFAWFIKQKETDGVKVVKKLIKENQLDWANWTIVRLMTHKQQVQYAVFAADQVIEIFEKRYPEDKRPRKAIEAAKECLRTHSEAAAANAADAARAAAADNAAANAAAYAAADAAELKTKIIKYGMQLIGEGI